MTIALITLATSAPALGQDAAPVQPPVQWSDDPRAQLQITLEPFTIAGFRTDFDAGGNVSVRRAGWKLSLRQTISRRWTLALNVLNEYSFADYNVPPALGGGDPVDLLTTTRFLPSATYRFNKRWTGTVTGRFEITGESGAGFGKSLLGGGTLTARQRVSERLTFGFGIGFMQRLESSVQIFPVPYFDWRPSDVLHIYSDHLGLTVERTLSGPWFLAVKARYEPREYRLDNRPGALLPGGVLRDESAIIGVEIGYRPRPGVEAALEAGSIVHQSIELLKANGGETFDDEADPTMFIAGRVRFRF